jgi:predicted RNA-binding Zn-ribbon protein involved in translation (DUF1610 family)
MAFLRQPPPNDGDLLCESCGYLLNGLEARPDGHCPECGEPLSTSLDPTARKLAPIEIAWSPASFWKTTGSVLFRKRKFFRETKARSGDLAVVGRFGSVHRILAAVLFGIAAAIHLAFTADNRLWVDQWETRYIVYVALAGFVFAAIAYGLLRFITWLAVRATAVESKFWGMRLSPEMLKRAMNFHAANYLPVGVLAVLVTGGYRIAIETNLLSPLWGVAYLVTLCVAVVAAALWLFESFVIAMRRIRLANF